MKVCELINLLSAQPQDMEVKVEVPCCCGSEESVAEARISPMLTYEGTPGTDGKWVEKDVTQRFIKIVALGNS